MGPIFRRLEGITNGANTLFETPTQYLSGSVQVFLNGILLEKNLADGWSEGGNRKILMKVPPLENDVVQAYYIPI
jgi:hypothetical protein